jgi:alpha-mannosidase
LRKIQEGLEKLFDVMIYNPPFMKYWERNQRSGRFYRETPVLSKIVELLFHYRMKDYQQYYIAQSHLDAEWLWTIKDSKVRAYKTFYQGIEHIEKYPYFSLSMTSPQYYDWIKRYDSKLWEQVKKYVKLGKIDTTGGCWIEPDLNVPSGEALVRQRLNGQLYYLRNFGQLSKVESLLDVFGYSNTLPQILVKSGAESLWVTKITWNDYTMWPFANFMWRSPDGSEIFTHQFKFNIMVLLDLGMYKVTARRPLPSTRGTVFNSHNLIDCRAYPAINIAGTTMGTIDFHGLKELKNRFSKDWVRTLGIFYGLGDGGKGPIDIEIGLFENLAQLHHAKHTTTHNYFRILKKDVGEDLVIWDDEMYLENHRGCLTTHSNVKKGNRLAENGAIAVELLSTLNLLSKDVESFNYPKAEFNSFWQKILFHQFHDILPGSSIPDVYPLTWKEHKDVINGSNEMINGILKNIYSSLPDYQNKYLIYNPVAVENEANISVDDFDIPITAIPPLGMLLLDKKDLIGIANKYNQSEVTAKDPSSIVKCAETDQAIIVENGILRALFSKVDGNLKGIQHISNEKSISLGNLGNILYGERSSYKHYVIPPTTDVDKLDPLLLRFRGARLKVFNEDFRGNPFPPWNICRNYTQHPVQLKLIEGVKLTNNGDKITILAKYSFKKSTAELKYTLRPGSDKLELDMKIDLKNPKHLLKYFMPLNLESEDITCETPYGNVLRKRKPHTNMERGKFEIGMQKWMDVSDSDAGVAILNDSRYGASANAKGMSVTLVRSPPYSFSPIYGHEVIIPPKQKPKYTDLMEHNYKFEIIPHDKTWKEAKIPSRALAFNNRPFVVSEASKIDSKPGDFKFKFDSKSVQSNKLKVLESSMSYQTIEYPALSCTQSNVIISAFKPSEWIREDSKQSINKSEGYSSYGYYLPEDPNKWSWDGKSLILRAYESQGIAIEAQLILSNTQIANQILKIEEVDLLERKPEPNSIKTSYSQVIFAQSTDQKNSVSIKARFTPYEIKTLLITLK